MVRVVIRDLVVGNVYSQLRLILSYAQELKELQELMEKDLKVWLITFLRFQVIVFYSFTALSYNSILQGKNLRWTLFIHCWRAKTLQNPNSVEIATSFNVFNLDPVLSAEDRALVIAELKKRGFNTDPSNLIEFDYTTTECN